ncbi:MAG: 2-dehydropantoate 2-reductase [Spirosomaceae bacterium]|jgi:2-dehydropantoate 2-reductase|nr:2-dehydropantoate 2-reductase [Spirosomataceae bacterium]
MKITILGGTGAMGGVFGARLFLHGHDVTLYDANQAAVMSVKENGLIYTDKQGVSHTLLIPATSDASQLPGADLVIIFVKGMYTQAALEAVKHSITPDTKVLSLQNGWGHSEVISGIIPKNQMVMGVTYASGVVTGLGQIKQVGGDDMFIGNWERPTDDFVQNLAQVFKAIGFNPVVSDRVIVEIWKKLSLNVCTLPTTAIPRLTADQVPTFEGLVELMQGILKETVAIAHANGIPLDYDERISYIVNLLKNAKGGRSSMLQDFEAKRPTEIDFINGAMVKAGAKAGIPTPYNHAMVCLIKAIQGSYTPNPG